MLLITHTFIDNKAKLKNLFYNQFHLKKTIKIVIMITITIIIIIIIIITSNSGKSKLKLFLTILSFELKPYNNLIKKG